MAGEILDIKDVSQYLKIKEQTAYRLAQQGKIPAVKIGGTWKVKKEHLDKMFNEILEAKLQEIRGDK
ncbi:MAG TPA: DNA-binding protein [Candidatus Marinimicrobia bacterium]|jgi:excisionase family DNA binding protein|nr:DNA-binding protein [Candidatus Neomarinimicrobiota bacterium]